MEDAVLITGATSGFGREFARIFARNRNNIVLVARSGDILAQEKQELEEEFGVTVTVLAKDLSGERAAEEVFAFTQEKGILIDTLVNNAGFGDWGEFASADMQKISSMVHLNVLTLMKLCRLYIPAMQERGSGRILNVASIAAFTAGPMMAAYYASKAFVLSLTESLSEELKESGIQVTALCPGPSNTGFAKLAALDGTSFAKMFSHTSARQVAEYGYKKLMRNKVIALPGASTRLMQILIKILPRSVARHTVYKMQKN